MSSQSRPTVAFKPKRPTLVKQEPSQDTSNSTLHQPATSTAAAYYSASSNISRGSSVAANANANANAGQKGGSDRKRGKFTVYQDKENNGPSKRRRLKGQVDHGSDSDKENRDPLAPMTPRKSTTTVLGEKTNFVNNVLNAGAKMGMSGKEVLKNVVASKIIEKAAVAPLATPRTSQSTQRQHQQRQRQQTRLHPSAPAETTIRDATVESTARRELDQLPRLCAADVQRQVARDYAPPMDAPQDTSPAVEESSANVTVVQSAQGASQDGLLVSIKLEPVDQIKLEPTSTSEWPVESRSSGEQEFAKAPETPTHNTAVSQVPASVEDDDSAGSFERVIKLERERERQVRKPAPKQPAVEYEEIPGSQASQESESFDSPASQEATFPMPEFLLEGLPEDPHYDEAEVTLVDADNPKQSSRRVFAATSPAGSVESVSGSGRRNSTLESTTYADGMWCIEDLKHRVVATACGFQEQWVALETTSHVQFWRLMSGAQSSKGQWVRHVNLPKTAARSTQVLFAPDDSFAVVVNGSEQSYTKVPLDDLEYLQRSDVMFPTFTWTGLKPSMACKGFVVEQNSDGNHIIVVATEEAGTIGFISIPDNENNTDDHAELQAKAVVMPGSEEPVSSIALIGNTSLIAATFGSTVAIWDVHTLGEPVSVVDTSAVDLIKPSFVYATVPIQFFEEEKRLGMDRSQPAGWPILAVFQDSEHASQCALYAMKGTHIERIHHYRGSSSISSACASSRFIACQVKTNGKDVLQLWNICKPEPAMQLSLLEPPSLEEVASQRSMQQQSIWQQQAASAVKEEARDQDQLQPDNDHHELFSAVSTLSPPPDDVSSPPYPSLETEKTEAILPEEKSPNPEPEPEPKRSILNIGSQRQPNLPERVSRPPTEWIDLTSVSAMERKEVQISMHAGHQWVVIVQKSASKKSSSVVHILDLLSILPPSSS
ncbi:hypothetical protein BGX23_003742 [Mortierella sp. AD031]|nr:hypothetical protein BGX23_003742 [Mortierella sp. AD031]